MTFFTKRLRSQGRKGFTMIELIVVIAIVGILTALVVPALTHDNRPARGKSLAKDMFYVTQDAMTDLKSVSSGGVLPSGDTIFYADMDIQGRITACGVFVPTSMVDPKEDFNDAAHTLGDTIEHRRLYDKLDSVFKKNLTGAEGMQGCLIAVVDYDYRVREAYWVEEDAATNAGDLLNTATGRTFVDDDKLTSGYLCTAFPTKYSSAAGAYAVFTHD